MVRSKSTDKLKELVKYLEENQCKIKKVNITWVQKEVLVPNIEIEYKRREWGSGQLEEQKE